MSYKYVTVFLLQSMPLSSSRTYPQRPRIIQHSINLTSPSTITCKNLPDHSGDRIKTQGIITKIHPPPIRKVEKKYFTDDPLLINDHHDNPTQTLPFSRSFLG
ncbi:uncharacterized protein GGS25DRAFT_188939 [Hypoxylon fragiforme]|uniref:uncharacterized protein n=1 Tax=Hypoxylon fragiforme TaxID=63214 RepID=UPI0020C6905F|nr:uncharacterized protein GGS25DRAFT_188939 [Hypoxylon fragiforme]KAI2611273.1 hypothetical protein GGS25DRAFT_188939 [Hypoxylon fragiforme]